MYDILKEFIKPELLVLVPVLYLIGMALKKSAVADKWIPAILGGTGILLSGLYIFATSEAANAQSVMMAVFTSVVQGVLCAGASVYFNQIIKQAAKEE